MLFNKDYFTPTNTLHTELQILLVNDIYKLNVGKFVFIQQHGQLPDIFDQTFKTNSTVHTHNTRQKNHIHMHAHKSASKYRYLKTHEQGTVIWNSFPGYIRDARTVNTFSKHTKKHLIENITH
jgi:hypothetical protein